MAKRNRTATLQGDELDDDLGLPEDSVAAAPPEEEKEAERESSREFSFRNLSLSMPVVIDHEARSPRHLDFQLTTAQGRGLRRIRDGLDHSGARLENGRRVQSYVEAIRWLLEKVAAESDG